MDSFTHDDLVERYAIRYMDENRHADYKEARQYAVPTVNYWHGEVDE
jgi:hypothetical protein